MTEFSKPPWKMVGFVEAALRILPLSGRQDWTLDFVRRDFNEFCKDAQDKFEEFAAGVR